MRNIRYAIPVCPVPRASAKKVRRAWRISITQSPTDLLFDHSLLPNADQHIIVLLESFPYWPSFQELENKHLHKRISHSLPIKPCTILIIFGFLGSLRIIGSRFNVQIRQISLKPSIYLFG